MLSNIQHRHDISEEFHFPANQFRDMIKQSIRLFVAAVMKNVIYCLLWLVIICNHQRDNVVFPRITASIIMLFTINTTLTRTKEEKLYFGVNWNLFVLYFDFFSW